MARPRPFPYVFPIGSRFYEVGSDAYVHCPGTGWFVVGASGLIPATDSPDSPPPLAVLNGSEELEESEWTDLPATRALHDAAWHAYVYEREEEEYREDMKGRVFPFAPWLLHKWRARAAWLALLPVLWLVAFVRAANHGRATVGAMEYQAGHLLFTLVPAALLALAGFLTASVAAVWLGDWERRRGGDGSRVDRASSVAFPVYVLLCGAVLLALLGRGVVFDTERGRSSLSSISRELRRIF